VLAVRTLRACSGSRESGCEIACLLCDGNAAIAERECDLVRVVGQHRQRVASHDPTWLTIGDSRPTHRADLRDLGARQADLRTNVCRVWTAGVAAVLPPSLPARRWARVFPRARADHIASLACQA
jgi:hypothetical protein